MPSIFCGYHMYIWLPLLWHRLIQPATWCWKMILIQDNSSFEFLCLLYFHLGQLPSVFTLVQISGALVKSSVPQRLPQKSFWGGDQLHFQVSYFKLIIRRIVQKLAIVTTKWDPGRFINCPGYQGCGQLLGTANWIFH